MFKNLLAAIAALTLVGCATDRSFGTASTIEVTDLTTLPVPAGATNFTLQPFDSVEVRVLQDPALNGTYFIDANGILNFPLVGELQADNLSTSQLTNRLTSALANGYIVDPDISIRPTAIRDVNVSFGGQVKNPGNYKISDTITLLRGINTAGGLTSYAKSDDVLILRTIDTGNYIGVYNLGAIERGNYPDPLLVPGDIVMVGDSPAKRRIAEFLPYLSILSTSAVLLDRVAR